MFNLHLTNAFVGVFPATIQISSRSHPAAIYHYKRALRARQLAGGPTTKVTLESAFGFRFRVDAAPRSTFGAVRLELPRNANHESVARALGGGNARIVRGRTGKRVTDPFGHMVQL